jgi:hypothetical protein
LSFKKETRVDSHKLQIILEKAVSFVYPVLPAITTQHASFIGFFNQCVSSFVSIFFSERFRVAGNSFTGGIRRISARIENTSRAYVFDRLGNLLAVSAGRKRIRNDNFRLTEGRNLPRLGRRD